MARRKSRKKEEINYWMSYSDMMAALLLVFVLLIAFTVTKTKNSYEEKEEKLKKQETQLVEQEAKLNEQQGKLDEQQGKIDEQQVKINEYQKKVDIQQRQLDKIVGIREEIVNELIKEFSSSDFAMSIDADTGAICFDSNVLFDYNEYKLKKEGIDFLNKFFPKYFDVILKDSVKDIISEVIIEGHTDDSGSYLYNLELSQKRAFAVAEYCLGDKNDMFTKSKLKKIRQIVTANGRSYYELKYDNNNKVDASASRRVEVKFRLKEEDMINSISDILSQDGTHEQ